MSIQSGRSHFKCCFQGKQGGKILVQGINTGVAWVKARLAHPSYEVSNCFMILHSLFRHVNCRFPRLAIGGAFSNLSVDAESNRHYCVRIYRFITGPHGARMQLAQAGLLTVQIELSRKLLYGAHLT